MYWTPQEVTVTKAQAEEAVEAAAQHTPHMQATTRFGVSSMPQVQESMHEPSDNTNQQQQLRSKWKNHILC